MRTYEHENMVVKNNIFHVLMLHNPDPDFFNLPSSATPHPNSVIPALSRNPGEQGQ
jgi:hypothetical protein